MTEANNHRRALPYDAYTECWYVPGETHIVDLIHPDDGLTLHAAEDERLVRARHPNAQRMRCEAAWTAADAAGTARYRQDITEITEERFHDALNVLPPVGWTTRQGVESFRISERLWGSITDIYARLGNRHFMLADDIRLPASTIAARVAAYVAAHPAGKVAVAADGPQRTDDTDRKLAGASIPAATPKPGGGL